MKTGNNLGAVQPQPALWFHSSLPSRRPAVAWEVDVEDGAVGLDGLMADRAAVGFDDLFGHG